jgi:pilus assembly protein CpaE
MKVDFSYTLLDAAVNLHRLDTDLWGGMVCHPQNGLDFLQAPGAARVTDPLTGDRVRHVLRFAQSQYRWVVVDLGRLTAAALTVLDETQDLFVVTNVELTALHETTRLLRKLLDAGFSPDHLKLILNRKLKSDSLTPADLEKALGYTCYGSIADYSDEMTEFYAQGRFLDDRLKLRKDVARIVGRWRGVEEKRPAPTGFGLLRRLRE